MNAWVPAPTITRCTGCGTWTWCIDTYGCQTCRLLAAQTTDTTTEEDGNDDH